MKHTLQQLREIIAERVPANALVPDHDNTGHWYKRPDGKRYPSVSTKLSVLEERGLEEWRINKALDLIFENLSSIIPGDEMNWRDKAEQASIMARDDAADIGRAVHGYREAIFREWIRTGSKPTDFQSFIPANELDIRAVSAIGALEKFCNDYHYTPVATEVLVYSDLHKLGGQLDDIGIIRTPRTPDPKTCQHEMVGRGCMKCPLRFKEELVLLDLKTSNQMKSKYWIQVALYYMMFVKLTGLRPTKQFILQVDKHNRSYKVEFIKNMGEIVKIAKAVLKVADGMDAIGKLREKEFITI